jgi:hypothetical protein
MNRRTSPESLALLCILRSRGLEAVLKAQLIAAVVREIELRSLTHMPSSPRVRDHRAAR